MTVLVTGDSERPDLNLTTVEILNQRSGFNWQNLELAGPHVFGLDRWDLTCDVIGRTLEDYFGGINVWNASPRADFIRLLAWNILSNQEV